MSHTKGFVTPPDQMLGEDFRVMAVGIDLDSRPQGVLPLQVLQQAHVMGNTIQMNIRQSQVYVP